MKALIQKELRYYFNNPIGFIVVGLFAFAANFLFLKDIFMYSSASLRPFFNVIPWISLIFVPALAMRMMAEEKRTNTLEILLSLPVTEAQIVGAKFVALCILLILGLILTLALPIALVILTKLYVPELAVGYLGSFLYMAAAGGVSLFFSSQTKNQVVAFLFSILTLFIAITMNSDFMANIIPLGLQNYVNMISPLYHLQNFIKGVIDIRSLFYFISAIVGTLWMTIVTLEKRG